MPGITYESLGSITGVRTNPLVATRERGRDRSPIQNLIFICDPNNPFTATVTVQGALDEPTEDPTQMGWADIARITFTNEGGTSFLQLNCVLTSIRIVCKSGDYTSGNLIDVRRMK